VQGDQFYSAPVEFLAFKAKVLEFKPRFMALQLEFMYPANISIGFSPDNVKVSWTKSNFSAVDGTKIPTNF